MKIFFFHLEVLLHNETLKLIFMRFIKKQKKIVINVSNMTQTFFKHKCV